MTSRWLSLAEQQGGKPKGRRHGGQRELRSSSPKTIDVGPWWKTYEAVLATPIVVLAARKKHLQGLGRLVGRFDAYWCVFLPDSVSLAWHTTVNYWCGSGVELKRTGSRAWFVVRVC
ncbi:hypothetical protein GQ600_25857 [Phytophthora cactorum]|nr:hypothetical protein GQ600_25857 [Phytophthora cactorum]